MPAPFLILGSAAPDLLRQSSESLAGRIETVALEGLRLSDLGARSQSRHWLRGGFPLASRPAPKPTRSPGAGTSCRPFWNAAELARALAINESTVRRYLDLMSGVFMLRQLPPWLENLPKRQVKAPKIYVRDSGLLHAPLGISNARDLEHHPKVGASWEGYAVEEVLKSVRPDEAYFWATHHGMEASSRGPGPFIAPLQSRPCSSRTCRTTQSFARGHRGCSPLFHLRS